MQTLDSDTGLIGTGEIDTGEKSVGDGSVYSEGSQTETNKDSIRQVNSDNQVEHTPPTETQETNNGHSTKNTLLTRIKDNTFNTPQVHTNEDSITAQLTQDSQHNPTLQPTAPPHITDTRDITSPILYTTATQDTTTSDSARFDGANGASQTGEVTAGNSRDYIFDHFIVAGIPPNAKAKRGQFLKPEVLYQYPPDKQVPPKVTEFCFPNGVQVTSVKRSTSGSSLNELLFGQPHLHSSSNSHVFYLTGEFQTLYGCCVTKEEFLRCTPNFLQTTIASHPLPQLPQYLIAPRCYCFLSRFPIFPMHFDVLFALLAQDRLITILLETQSQLPTPLHPEPTPDTPPTSNNNTPSPAAQSPAQTPGSTASAEDSMESLDVTFQKRLSLSGETFDQLQFQFTYAKELHDILEYYHNQNVLQPGQSTLLKIPGDLKKPTTFYCPMAPSIYEAGALQLADWCLTPLFKHLSLDNILKIFAAALLEHKLIFLCENLNTLSAAVLSMVPLLYPFVWQGIYIPVLPINLHEYLDAPVPFIVGLQSLRRRNLEAIIVDLNANKLIFDGCSQPVAMPEYKKLYYNLEGSHKVLFDVNNKNHNPFNNTAKMLAAVHEIIHTLQAYIFWLIKKIEDFFSANPAEISDSLSVEGFKHKFLETVSGPNKGFVRQFLDTQLFSFYLHSHMGPATKGKRVPLG